MSTEFDRRDLKTRSIGSRKSKVNSSIAYKPATSTISAADFTDSLPDVLAVRDMRKLASAMVNAEQAGSARILMYGGHVIKCGLGTLLVDWLKKGRLSALATNGAGTIHDLEISLFGETSEDVESGISDGSFGMWTETAEIYASALDEASETGTGLGESLGRQLLERGVDPDSSPLAYSCMEGIPVSVHPALGGDIVHPHSSLDWARLGAASERDFDLLGRRICQLSRGVIINAGSSVIMPEVFLKLLTSAINLGNDIRDFTAASFDMIRQYRPLNNVVMRPTRALGGTPIVLTGHHELMLPLLDIFIDAEEAR